METLTHEEIRAIAAEIDAWNSHYPRPELSNWHIHAIIALDLPVEAYEVVYQSGYTETMFRNEDGKLEPAERHIYYAHEYNGKETHDDFSMDEGEGHSSAAHHRPGGAGDTIGKGTLKHR